MRCGPAWLGGGLLLCCCPCRGCPLPQLWLSAAGFNAHGMPDCHPLPQAISNATSGGTNEQIKYLVSQVSTEAREWQLVTDPAAPCTAVAVCKPAMHIFALPQLTRLRLTRFPSAAGRDQAAVRPAVLLRCPHRHRGAGGPGEHPQGGLRGLRRSSGAALASGSCALASRAAQRTAAHWVWPACSVICTILQALPPLDPHADALPLPLFSG